MKRHLPLAATMRIELQNVTLRYPDQTSGRPQDKQPLFSNLNVLFASGDFAIVRGPSGSGKSSLLRLFNRLQEPTAGRITIDGRPIATLPATQLRRRIGYVQQTPVMVRGTVRDNLLFPFQFAAAGNATAPTSATLRDRLHACALDAVSLDADATVLSVGQKQRIALIRSLFAAPEFLLCDEPTSALDPESAQWVERELKRHNRDRQLGIIAVTHQRNAFEGDRARHFNLAAGVLEEVTP